MNKLLTTFSLVVTALALGAVGASASITPPPDYVPAAISGSTLFGYVNDGKANLIRTIDLATKTGSDIAASQSNNLVSSSWGVAMTANPSADGSQAQLLRVPAGGVAQIVADVPAYIGRCKRYVVPVGIDAAGTMALLDVAQSRVNKRCAVDAAGTKLYRLTTNGARTNLWLPRLVKARLTHGAIAVGGDTAVLTDGPRRSVVMDLAKRKITRVFRSSKTLNEGYASQVAGDGSVLVEKLWTGRGGSHKRRFYRLRTPSSAPVGLPTLNPYYEVRYCGTDFVGYRTLSPFGGAGNLAIIGLDGALRKTVKADPDSLIIPGPCNGRFAVAGEGTLLNTPNGPVVNPDELRVFDLKTATEL